MLKIRIIAMGKLTVDYFRTACEDYLKRMSRAYSVTVIEPKPEALPKDPSDGDIARALEKEAVRITEAIPPRAAVVAMCYKPMRIGARFFVRRACRENGKFRGVGGIGSLFPDRLVPRSRRIPQTPCRPSSVGFENDVSPYARTDNACRTSISCFRYQQRQKIS